MAKSWGSRMSALAKWRLEPSACRPDTAAPLQKICNIHVDISHIWNRHEPLCISWLKAVLMSCPQSQHTHYQNSPLLTLASNSSWKGAVTVREPEWGSGAEVTVRLKHLPRVCLEDICGCSQPSPRTSILARGLEDLPAPYLQVSVEGGCMEAGCMEDKSHSACWWVM